MQYRLLTGACGWRHAGWAGSFYPDDLPPEWRLTYYANEFRTVLAPADYIDGGEDLSAWCADTDPAFSFVCELAPTVGAALADAARTFAARITALGERCAGILLRLDVISDVEPNGLDAALRIIAAHWPVAVELSAAVVPALLEPVLARHGVGRCWHGGGEPAPSDWGAIALTRLRGPLPDLRALRTVIETCLAAGTQGPAVLLVDGTPPSIELLHQAGTIRDLL